MRNRKIAALLLAAALLLSACGENAPAPAATPSTSPETPRTYFSAVWRGDTPFDEIGYEHCTPDGFAALTAPIYAMAERGGTVEALADADAAALDELCYIYDQSTLAGLESYAAPDNSEAAAEQQYSRTLYYTLNAEYCRAMHALAVSPYAALLEELYHEDYCEWFRGYTEDPGATESLSREDELVQHYYALAGADVPEAAAECFVELVALRRETAAAAGYGSYADYAYDNLYYKYYTPADIADFTACVKERFVPLVEEYGPGVDSQSELLWSADGLDCSPEAVLVALGRTLPRLSPELSAALSYLLAYGLCDIEPEAGKADVGFTTRLYYWNEPFVFDASYGDFTAYLSMFHEFGHFANTFYTTGDLLFGMPDNDLSELQSQGLELLLLRDYGEIFGPTLAPLVRDYTLMSMLRSVVEGAMYDEFQQRVYAEPSLTAARVSEIFAEVSEAYGCDFPPQDWIWVAHNFEYPFYYISYAVSAVGALELYALSLRDWDAAVDKYLRLCAMDTEQWEYSAALEEVGLGSFLDGSVCAAAAAAAQGELEK